ncbi:MAG: lysophospholipid acyltransferase family protein [Actinomycetota bacterium]
MGSLAKDLRTAADGWRWGKRPLVPRSAEPFAPREEPGEFPTGWARTPVARVARDAIQRYALKPLVWNETRVKVRGLDNLEGLEPPVIFISNHTSHLDAPLLLCSLPPAWRGRTAVGAAADYFFDVWWRAAATALVFNAFPVERAGGTRATTTAIELLTDGWNLVVFPEGTRSKDGWMQRFRSGAARLAIVHGVPVVPIAVRGSYAAMPRGRGWPRPGRFPISVRYGRAIRAEPDANAREFCDEMSGAIARLMDEDRTTWWDSLRREAAGETPSVAGPVAPRWRRVWESTAPIADGRRKAVWSARR